MRTDKVKSYTILSISSIIVAYAVILAGGLLDLKGNYFILCQTFFGIFTGIAAGVGFCCCTITTQQWMDKKRARLNPFLIIGAPVFAFIAPKLFNWLCDLYSWTGAVLISIGILAHGFIICILFRQHPGWSAQSLFSSSVVTQIYLWYRFCLEFEAPKEDKKLHIYDPRLKNKVLVKVSC